MSSLPTITNRTQAVTTTADSLKKLVKAPVYADRFREVLGPRTPQFISSLLSLGASMKDVEPNSVIASAMQAACLDLPIDKNLGFAWIIPYKKKGVGYAQFQMGYKGYIQLALRTGQYENLNVTEVFEGELTKYDRLSSEMVIDPTQKKNDTVIGYAAFLKLTSGFKHAEFWTIEDVKKHAQNYSQAYRSAIQYRNNDAPWIANFDEMAKKTVLSMLIRKWGPMSIQIQNAINLDQGIKKTLDADIEYPDNSDAERPAIQAPKFDGPAELPPPSDDDQVPGVEMPTREASAPAPEAEPDIPPPASEEVPEPPKDEYVPDMSQPYNSLFEMIKRAGLTNDQALAYCKHLKFAKDNQKLEDLASHKHESLIKNWATHLAAMQKIQRGTP
jgi:recombination protein RecT